MDDIDIILKQREMIEEYARMAAEAQQKYDSVVSGLSWKITAPLRTAVRAFRSVFQTPTSDDGEKNGQTLSYRVFSEKVPKPEEASERMKRVIAEANRGKKNVVYLYPAPDTSTYRYRCYNIYQVLEDIGSEWQASCFFNGEEYLIEEILPYSKVLVLARVQWTPTVEKLVLLAREKNIPVMYDVDDLVFDPDIAPLLVETICTHPVSNENLNYWFGYILRTRAAASLADGFLCTGSYLAEKLTACFHKPCYVIPNSLNREQRSVSEIILKERQERQKSDPFTVGYFSGTETHQLDFQQAAPFLGQFLEKYGNTRLLVVGHLRLPEELEPFLRREQIVFLPFMDYLSLQSAIALADVNIVPLLTNDFSNCKSELKYFEAAAVKTPTLASPTSAYSHAVKDGVTGFLCSGEKWLSRLEELYLNPERARLLAENAYEHCLRTYFGAAVAEAAEKAFNDFTERCARQN